MVAKDARIPYAPGLDGLRGLAVLAVLVFHAGPSTWMTGGFLGVSLFFTLSGYLIASLIIAEVTTTGSLSLARFWARRVRRLVPAVLLLAVGVIVLSHLIELPRSTRGELVGGLLYVANWVQLASGTSYAELFVAPSALTHLWSLAIEEQFYVVFPLLAWLVARRQPGRVGLRRAMGLGSVAVIVVGLGVAWFADDQSFTYYSTITRAPEIGVGVILAVVTRTGDRQGAPWITAVGLGSLVVTVWAWRATTINTEWVARGGLTVFALASVGLVLAAVRSGPVSRMLGVRPLREVGKISYGLYLYHWPVVVVLSRPRVTWDPILLFTVRSVVSLALAVVSYRLIEGPIRHGAIKAFAASPAAIRAGLGSLVVMAAVVLVTVPVPPTAEERAASRPAPALLDSGGGEPTSTVTTPPGATTTTAPPGPPVVAVFGDSIPNWMIRDGAHALDPEVVGLVDGSGEGCDGAEGSPTGRAGSGVVVTVPPSCTGWSTQYPPVFEARTVDVAVLMIGSGAILDRELNGEFHGPCSDVAADWYRADVAARLDYLAERAARVVLVLPAWSEDWSRWVNPPDHRDRTDCVRETLRGAVDEHAATGTGTVEVLDLGEHLCPEGPGECRPVRESDGVHIDPEVAPEILQWVVDQAISP